MAPRTPPYVGAKKASQPSGIGRWVAHSLPTDARVYVEPYGGMAGVLLQRPRARLEILNDANRLIYGWWVGVRDWGPELQRWIDHTPHSAAQLAASHAALRHPERLSPVELAGHVWANLSLSWRTCLTDDYYRIKKDHELNRDIEGLVERLRHVALECREGASLIRQWGKRSEALIYCDPPYDGAEHYYGMAYSWEDLYEAATGAEARVAVSGHPGPLGDALDDAGWHRRDRSTGMGLNQLAGGSNAGRRLECLWTNWAPQEALFDL